MFWTAYQRSQVGMFMRILRAFVRTAAAACVALHTSGFALPKASEPRRQQPTGLERLRDEWSKAVKPGIQF